MILNLKTRETILIPYIIFLIFQVTITGANLSFAHFISLCGELEMPTMVRCNGIGTMQLISCLPEKIRCPHKGNVSSMHVCLGAE